SNRPPLPPRLPLVFAAGSVTSTSLAVYRTIGPLYCWPRRNRYSSSLSAATAHGSASEIPQGPRSAPTDGVEKPYSVSQIGSASGHRAIAFFRMRTVSAPHAGVLPAVLHGELASTSVLPYACQPIASTRPLNDASRPD